MFGGTGARTGAGSWHGHNVWCWMVRSNRDRSCLGLYQHLSGATAEEERETRSEAERKIEADFLAGVEIMDEQMM